MGSTISYEHKNHQEDSNFLMNLFEAAFLARYPRAGYRVRYQTVYEITDPSHSRLAEHIFTTLAGAYTEHGGFNNFWAGWSNKLTERASAASYQAAYERYGRSGLVDRNMHDEEQCTQQLYERALNALKISHKRKIVDAYNDLLLARFRQVQDKQNELHIANREDEADLRQLPRSFRQKLARLEAAREKEDKLRTSLVALANL
ncbi:hypothetical protein BDZ85DRAFT_267680 [Elsinoe ampelina]|uniref:Uncharacterized protein n=1 Tax=Elsinoe ampelina TaxID=302913 RepID=A0A6A6G2K2_9PEZI|nr:hypothetical protein BDZ85DRAFT_267680 [Elsinoe ampelina]